MCAAAGCNTRGGVTSRDSEQITSLTTRYGLPRVAIVASAWRDSTAGSAGTKLPSCDINKPNGAYLSLERGKFKPIRRIER